MRAIAIGVVVVAVVVVVATGITPGRHTDAAFPGTNGVLAYESLTEPTNGRAYVVNSDGSSNKRITSSSNTEFQPIWSPDGTKIAFTSLRNGNLDIFIVNANGSGERRLTTHPGNDASATWSPDGTRLIFDTSRDGNFEIYVINADGTGERNITQSPTDEVFPVFSPSGQHILFTKFIGDGPGDVWVMNADGTGAVNLTNSAGHEFVADWSPDGGRIAFTRDGDIWVMNASGGSASRLAGGSSIESAPAWSPDGLKIAFSSDRDGNDEIYVMDANGANQTRVTNHPNQDGFPDWQPLPPVTCTIASVIDGDSFTCTDGKTIDMLQIDAAELGQCGGGWAKAALENIFLTPGRNVRLDFDRTQTAGGSTLAAPVAKGTDGVDYNISIIMAYVGLAKSATVGASNTRFLDWANASQAWAQAAQWNMWAPGKTYTGGCD